MSALNPGGAEGASSIAALSAVQSQVRAAAAGGTPLWISGGSTKAFLNHAVDVRVLSLAAYAGIIAYQPSELVLEVRAGTRLMDIEKTLRASRQMLAFEPPRLGPASTIGGVISAGLSGPARPYAGALRDHVLGVSLLSPAGEILRFGGRVMKNVAGYDVSRLAAGAWGTLGPLVDISLRVAPLPESAVSVAWPSSEVDALRRLNELARQVLPCSGACYDAGTLRLRLAGTHAAVEAALAVLSPPVLESDLGYWEALRDLRLPFFVQDPRRLWRLAVAPATPPLKLDGAWLHDWGGAQRWLKSDLPPAEIHAVVAAAGGYALPFFAGDTQCHPTLSGVQRVLHGRIKASFDPFALFNPSCRRIGF